MERKIELPEIASMLHSCFFGMENAHSKLIGSGHRAIVPEIAKMLPGILEAKGELKFDENSTIDDDLQRLQEYFNNDQYFNKVLIEKIDDNKYLFQIDGCFLAKTGVHKVLKPEHNTCLFAFIMGAVIHNKTGKSIRLFSSEFFDEGTRTIIEIV
ncbi:MAG: hypothetical protein E4G94_04575 [ANME-2 cluster archaeon]|nr:MAG: hypothetical protein E4G94_04575 [ANME-2 cluster archaeon]